VPARPVGELLRGWRRRRRLSQLELSHLVEVSTRHLSFVETGRSRPTPQLILRLSEHLDVPLRERNQLLLAGGFAPAYPEHGLAAPELVAVRDALGAVLRAHLPHPALLLDRWWDLLDANDAVAPLLERVDPDLLVPPVNVLRLTLHPGGLAPRITNLAQWRAHLMRRLRERSGRTGDPRLRALAAELDGYPGGADGREEPPGAAGVVVPLRIRVEGAELSLFSVTSHVATAADVTVDELELETFLPADEMTAAALRRPRAEGGGGPATR